MAATLSPRRRSCGSSLPRSRRAAKRHGYWPRLCTGSKIASPRIPSSAGTCTPAIRLSGIATASRFGVFPQHRPPVPIGGARGHVLRLREDFTGGKFQRCARRVSFRVSLHWRNPKTGANGRKRLKERSFVKQQNPKDLADVGRQQSSTEKQFVRLPASQPLHFQEPERLVEQEICAFSLGCLL